MAEKVEIVYFPKPCPHCREMLFRVEKMSLAWSECRNKNCSFLQQDTEDEPIAYTECVNRR